MHPSDPQQPIIDWLSRPAAYGGNRVGIQHIETHISHVFIADDLVFKLKKPVSFDFLDFSRLDLREKACRDELQLNRRTAPDVYIDVLPIYQCGASFTLGAFAGALHKMEHDSSKVVEWVVVMRRLPGDQMMDRLIERGQLTAGDVARLADFLNRFHDTAGRLMVNCDDYKRHILEHVYGNQTQLMALGHHLPMETVERVHSFQLQLLHLEPELFDQRVLGKNIIDGHGDLRPEHICLTNTIAIYDCVEFNADFRTIDRADEIAFLAAECDYLGAEWIGPKLFDACCQHVDDTVPEVLWDFYKSYRACVRAKVAALRADQLDGGEQAEASDQALRHLRFADRYAGPWLHPLLIIVGGLSGTGKSTLACELARELGAEWLRTDTLRNAGLHKDYSLEGRARVYHEMFKRARDLTSRRVSVVLDATFSFPGQIELAKEIAEESESTLVAIECICRPEIARQRIAKRQLEGRDASDATIETYEAQLRATATWPEEIRRVQIDTEQEIALQKAIVYKEMQQRINRQP